MKTRTTGLSLLRARRREELERPWQRGVLTGWNLAALLLSSLGTTVLSLALAIGTYEVEEFIGYFAHPVILLLNWLPVLLLQLLLYALSGRQWLAFLLSALPVLLASAGDYYKIQFRYEPFTFQDMDSILAGLQVAGAYSLTLNKRILAAAAWVLLGTPALGLLARLRPGKWQRLAAGALALLSALPLWFGVYANGELYKRVSAQNTYIGNISEQQNFIAAGFVYPFLHSIETGRPHPPEGYDPAAAAAVLARYPEADIPADRRVNILVLQLESFTDLEAAGFPGVAPGTYDLLHRIQAESISGVMAPSVIGGGTIRTERCVLTGDYGMPVVTRDHSSYVRYFNDQGYFTTGSHPNRADFYNRVNVCRYLGFAEYFFAADHYEALTGGKWNCDGIFLPEVFRLFREDIAEGKQVFSFNVSLQGHGPYTADSVNYQGRYWLDDSVSPETREALNSYLALMAETQEVLWQELEQIRSAPEPVVVLIYGDHPPTLGSQDIYAECGVIYADTGEDFLRRSGTPYMIWANDAAKELLGSDFTGEGPAVSPGYLMAVLFDALGWQGSSYLQYTAACMEHLPVINNNGSYVEDGVFRHELSPAGEALLWEYSCVQYYMHTRPVEEP